MKYLSLQNQLLKERKKNDALIAESEKHKADIDYLAMMCDVELELPNAKGDEDTEHEEG